MVTIFHLYVLVDLTEGAPCSSDLAQDVKAAVPAATPAAAVVALRRKERRLRESNPASCECCEVPNIRQHAVGLPMSNLLSGDLGE